MYTRSYSLPLEVCYDIESRSVSEECGRADSHDNESDDSHVGHGIYVWPLAKVTDTRLVSEAIDV